MPDGGALREILTGRAVAADGIRIAEVVHAEVAARADAVDRRVREQRQPRAHDRHRQGEIDAIGHAVCERPRVLRNRGFDGVDRRDHVGAAAAGFRVVVREHRRDVGQRHAIQMVVREELIRVAERDLAEADRFAALGQDRAEAPRGSDERAGRRVEVVGEPRRGRGQRHRRQLAGQRHVHEAELRLECAVEVRRVVAAVELHVVAVQHQPVRSVDVLEECRQGRRAIPGLCERRRRRGQQRDRHGENRGHAGPRGGPAAKHNLFHRTLSKRTRSICHSLPARRAFIVVRLLVRGRWPSTVVNW